MARAAGSTQQLATVSRGAARRAAPSAPSEHPGLVPTDSAALRDAEREIAREAVFIDAPTMAGFLQQHLGQKLTAYLAGVNDVKAVGQWARHRNEPSAIVRERLRAAYHVTALFTFAYSDRAAQAWFFGANAALDDHAPAASLRNAETPEEIARVVPVARAFVRSAR